MSTKTTVTGHKIVSPEEWVTSRKEFLEKEKEFTRLRDELSRQRRKLPWVRVEKNYAFDGPDGKETLADIFDGRGQLIIYHFMFDPEWSEGCKSCSFFADQYNPAVIHLRQRDVSMVTVSRAPLEKLLSFRKRMGWTFKWVSSYGNDFNRDFHVTFTAEELASGAANYNYDFKPFPVAEAPGISVFFKDNQGNIFHTYSTYARGLDIFLTTYNLLDIVPKGRDEDGLNYSMEWIRHHDRYGDDTFVDPYVKLLSRGPGKS
jgi:predicted dithiol-disulfide oxidoreductase (DUF899 family)